MTIALLALVALLAYANGANDNSKGVATSVGYGAATVKQALIWAAITTGIGAGISFWFSGGLLKSFSTGLFTSGVTLDTSFFICVLIGAFGWVIFATFTGLPVSTTHAITGALLGAGLVAFGQSSVRWNVLARGFVTPLFLGPLISLAIVYVLAGPVVWFVGRADSERETHENQPSPTANAIHWFSGGLVGFARGWNDAPKIAALCLVALPGKMSLAFAIVTIAMAVGGLISARKVLETMARKLTPLPLAESLTASLTTAAMVCLASWKGLPVSTTHVSAGAIIGAGLKNDPAAVKWKKVTEVLLSWVITLPVAALVAAAAKLLIR